MHREACLRNHEIVAEMKIFVVFSLFLIGCSSELGKVNYKTVSYRIPHCNSLTLSIKNNIHAAVGSLKRVWLLMYWDLMV